MISKDALKLLHVIQKMPYSEYALDRQFLLEDVEASSPLQSDDEYRNALDELLDEGLIFQTSAGQIGLNASGRHFNEFRRRARWSWWTEHWIAPLITGVAVGVIVGFISGLLASGLR